jgi:hypothetical protein
MWVALFSFTLFIVLNCQNFEYGDSENAHHVDRQLFPWPGVYGIYNGVSMTYAAKDVVIFLFHVNRCVSKGGKKRAGEQYYYI